MKKKKTLLRILFIPVLVVVLIQGIMPFFMLVFSGIRTKMEDNVVDMDNHIVENRQVVLENDMIEHWRSIYKESDSLNEKLKATLNKNGIDAEFFVRSEAFQQEYLEQVFPDLVDALQYNTTSGVYLILANNNPVDEAAKYHGFFVRDSDPQNKTASNTDLLLERGDKKLAQKYSISLDSVWSTDFSLAGSGNRESDSFYYQPYLAALAYRDVSPEKLGYWAKPFILEDHYMDNHQMIAYSVPLVYDDVVYGVLGVEVSVNYLNNYFQVKDLDNGLNSGYSLMIQKTDGYYESVAGKGALYDAVTRDDEKISLEKQSKTDLYLVNGATVGKQKIYAVVKPLGIYAPNTPYEDTEWALCGLVTENSIYGAGRSIYMRMILAGIFCVILAMIAVYLMVRYVTKPVYRLVESVRGGVDGIHQFRTANILEVDELHDVVEDLTDAQQRTEDQLLEEKERYRIAVESSKDMFFTFRRKERLLELVNSRGYDGIWDCGLHPEFIENDSIYPEDKDRIFWEITTAKKEINVEFRLRMPDEEDYNWVNLIGTVIQDETGDYSRIVGSVHNIQQRKSLEEAQKNKQLYDSLTSCYRLTPGLDVVRQSISRCSGGILAVIDIRKFAGINERYGLVFGDILLEQLAGLLRKECKNSHLTDVVYIRAGADQIMIWAPETEIQVVLDMLHRVSEAFAGLTDDNYLELGFNVGLASVIRSGHAFDIYIERAKHALAVARREQQETIVYDELPEEEKKDTVDVVFGEIDTSDRLHTMGLSTIALNLFDRGGQSRVALDMLALKLQEYYHLDNLIVTNFGRDYMVNSCAYIWKQTKRYQVWDGIVHCTEAQYQKLMQDGYAHTAVPVTENIRQNPVFGSFIDDEMEKGIIYHMQDNGQYSGSIIFAGIDPEVLTDSAEQKCFDEVTTIIQNRINLERHDLSAQAKSDFLARMSHEIRTPMNGIIGMTEIALQENQTEERRIDCLKKIDSTSNYLLGLLNDILDMSKIESGKMKLVVGQCNLRQMLNNISVLLETKMAEKNMHFEQEIMLSHEWVLCDELRLKQILVNLLSNAVKYSNAGGNVRLTVREQMVDEGHADLTFEVQDDGIGIAEDKQKLIFLSFEQADESANARRQGSGLGLAICSRLVRMMNSDIELESSPNKGSTFRFTIRLSVLENTEPVAEKTVEKKDYTGRKVLVVEDNELNMEIISTILKGYGITVEAAWNGEEAVSQVKEHAPGYYDLILMDIMMPVMDGLEATRTIRTIERADCRTIPIVAMSANAFDEDVRMSLESGMNGHLSKPINIGKLEELFVEIWD